MLVKPAVLLLSAAVVTIVVTASTAADASFRGGIGMGSHARTFSYAPKFPTPTRQMYVKPSYEPPAKQSYEPPASRTGRIAIARGGRLVGIPAAF